MSAASKWTSVAFPKELVEAVRKLIKEWGYWPSVTSFCREAVLEKIKRERKLLKELGEDEEEEVPHREAEG